MSRPSPTTQPGGSAAGEPSPELQRTLGVGHLLFTVLAFNAPLAVTVALVPVVIGFGNGVGAPVAFVVAGAILGLFSIGFTTMSRHLPNPGGFYAYVTAGLGRPVGLGSSFLALLAYYVVTIGSYCYGGRILNSLVHDTYHGPDVTWWQWAIILQALVGVLSYFRVDLSAKVLAVLLVCEIAVVLLYDASVAIRGGAEGLGLTSFTPHAALSGSIGTALLFSILCFGGFEVTTIFRDEARDPERTIPRATYGVVALVTVLYALGAWTLIQAYGSDQAVAATAADPTGSALSSLQSYGGHVIFDIATVLINTSVFAALLSAQQVVTRYVFNLSADGILHRALSGVHAKHGSPHRAAVFTSAAMLLGLIPFVVFGADPATLYAPLTGIFGYALLLLLLLTGVSVIVYLRKRKDVSTNLWKSVIAPALALIGLGITLVLATLNFDLLVGDPNLTKTSFAVIYGVFAIGLLMGLVYRKKRPHTYARIGRQ